MPELDHVSYSSITDYDQCHRYYHLKRIEKVKLKKTPPYFSMGRAVHKGIECLVKGLPVLSNMMHEFGSINLQQMDAKEVARLELDKCLSAAIVGAWEARFPQIWKSKDVLSEEKATVKLGKMLPDYLGYLDLLWKDEKGDWWIIDVKTATSPQPYYFDALHMNHQFISYMFLAKRILGVWPKGVKVHVIRKPTIRLKQKESLDQFIARAIKDFEAKPDAITVETVRYRKEQLLQWHTDMMKKVTGIKEIHDNPKVQPPMSTGNCTKGFSPCEYLTICRTGRVNLLVFDKELHA